MQELASVENQKLETMDSALGFMDCENAIVSKQYHNLEKLGHGTQATMLKALDAQERPVAIKVFDYGSASGWKDYDLFKREIEVLKSLHIDGVPRYIESIQTDQKLYLVEEFVDAPSLEKQIKAGRRFTASECESILRNAARILQKLSEHIPPIIHRDIKPANMLVDKDLNVHLVDFGVVAKADQTVSTTFAGTAGYVSPEQIYGKTTPASDIYSLGATMLHLLTHVAPSDMQLNGITLDFDKYIPKSVPTWLSQIIKKMMSIDPSERPQTGGELIAWIDRLKNECSQSESHAPSQSESHAKGQVHALANTNGENALPEFLIDSYRRYGKNSMICYAILILFTLLCVAGFFILPLLKILALCLSFGSAFFIVLFAIMSSVYESRKKRLLLLPELMDVNKELVEKALKGDAVSQYFIGKKYESGDGALPDERLSLAWYELSAKGGCAQAQAIVEKRGAGQNPG